MSQLPDTLVDEILELLHELGGHHKVTRDDHSPSPRLLRVSQALKDAIGDQP